MVLSDDTDVFFILLMESELRVYRVMYVMKDNVHDVDYVAQCAQHFMGMKVAEK